MDLVQISKMAPEPPDRSVLAAALDEDQPFAGGGPSNPQMQQAIHAQQMQRMQQQLQAQQMQLAHQAGQLQGAQQAPAAPQQRRPGKRLTQQQPRP